MGLLQQLVELFAGTRDRGPDLRAFRKALEGAVADGVLTDLEISELEKLKKQFKLSDQDVKKFKKKAYDIAFKHAFAQGHYTPRKQKELERIQTYLGMADGEVQRYTRQMAKLRTLTDLKAGKLPEADVHGMEWPKGERAHWKATVFVLADEDYEGVDDPAVLEAAARGNPPCRVEEPLPALEPASQGLLIATNRRFLFKSPNKTFSLSYDQVLGTVFHPDGLRVLAEGGKAKRLRYVEKQDEELTALVLSAVLRP
ncbi:MAG: hypothetical protein VKQ33_15905 [Candidatus Sericytochromatia bacterium]|nr:hypothetical protein [Candidatus Sericytochromatia bacterium]